MRFITTDSKTDPSVKRKPTPGRHGRKNNARLAAYKDFRETETIFVGIDGEGITLADGTHKYVMLGIGQDQLINPAGLHHDEIFSFLWEHRKPGKVAYCGFFLGYDFTEWLQSISSHEARMLLTSEGKSKRKRRHTPFPFPVYVGGYGEDCKWDIDILATKRFRFRPHTETEENDWMVICDTGPFFQKSFLKVINPADWKEPVTTPEEYATILEGKANRATAQLTDDMAVYNRLENEVLSRVLTRLDAGFRELGIYLRPENWYGPGQAAQAWLKKIGAPTNKELFGENKRHEKKEPNTKELISEWHEWVPGALGCVPVTVSQRTKIDTHAIGMNHWTYAVNGGQTLNSFIAELTGHTDVLTTAFTQAARYSYYGGWFEIMAHGIIPGTVWEYDINSAYPYAISQLPCLKHGKWSYGTGSMPDVRPGDLCLVHASLEGTNRHIGAMPHRSVTGAIKRPKHVTGFYWLDEISAAVRAKIVNPKDTVIHEWWRYQPCDCPPPIAEVAELYALRKKVGKNTPLGIACKLVPNSLYGKFAQSIGTPMFANPVYASRITASCRIQILNAIASHPKGFRDVVMVATDGVYFRSQHTGLPLTSELGDWEEGRKENLTLFKPGVYWDDKTRAKIAAGDKASFKARGVNAADMSEHLEGIDAHFQRIITAGKIDNWPKITFPMGFPLMTATQAAHWNRWEEAGTIMQDKTATQSSNPDLKRCEWEIRNGIIMSRCDFGGDLSLDENYPGNQPNYPYDKRFGMDDLDNPFSELSLEQFGITPDGLPGNTHKEILYD